MASSGNFCVFSVPTRPRSPYSTSDQITGGGLSIKGPSSGSFEPCVATISPSSGKWYWEYRAGQGGGSTYGRPSIAVHQINDVKNEDYYGGESGATGVMFAANDGQKRINNSDSSYGNAVSQHDIVQMALDCDNGAMYFGINNTWQNSGNPESGASKTGAALSTGIQNVPIDIIHTRYNGGGIDQYNFGQDDTFAGAISSAGNTDGNGFGNFKYAPPSGYLALCSANLPTSSDIDASETDDDIPTKQFGVVLYTGNGGASQSITGLGFQPDLVWLKQRSASEAYSNNLVDSSRGRAKLLYSHDNRAERTSGSDKDFGSFDSDGFTVQDDNESNMNQSTITNVAWCWRANGGTTSTNTQGDITTTVQANTKAGFSIFTYTGNGGGANTTMGHGLSQAPDIWFLKQRSNNGESSQKDWRVMLNVGTTGAFSNLNGSNHTLVLNSSAAAAGLYRNDDNFEPTSTTVHAPDNGNANSFFVVSGNTYVSYCWHSVDGFSKFGIYEGNGNADGPFVYTGFRPALIFIKSIDSSDDWVVIDSARATFNVTNAALAWNLSNAEQTSNRELDILANGFKPRTSNSNINGTNTYIFGAWADVSFKYNNPHP